MIIGYELVVVLDNFFYLYFYMMNYGEFFIYIGVFVEYVVYEYILLFGGYIFGWDSGFENFFDVYLFLGGVDI